MLSVLDQARRVVAVSVANRIAEARKARIISESQPSCWDDENDHPVHIVNVHTDLAADARCAFCGSSSIYLLDESDHTFYCSWDHYLGVDVDDDCA